MSLETHGIKRGILGEEGRYSRLTVSKNRVYQQGVSVKNNTESDRFVFPLIHSTNNSKIIKKNNL